MSQIKRAQCASPFIYENVLKILFGSEVDETSTARSNRARDETVFFMLRHSVQYIILYRMDVIIYREKEKKKKKLCM